MDAIARIPAAGLDTVFGVAPLAGLVLFFQIAVLRRRLVNPGRVVVGFVCVAIGLVLFLIGLEEALFPLACDSGGVTPSTVTVPLVAALGLGLAANVPGRSPLIDGFGLIAFASVFPIIAVLGYAQLSSALTALRRRRLSRKGT